MKKLLALIAAALVVIAGSQLVSTGGATGQATIARRVASLERKVKSLQTSVKALKANAACESTVIPVSLYGTPGGTAGYLYTPDGGVTVYATNALDLTFTGQTPAWWLPVVASDCVSQSKPSHYKPAHFGRRAVGPTHLKLHAK